MEQYELCTLCPRKCGVLRPLSTGEDFGGRCGMGRNPVVARAGIHMWEEPCVSGTNGSGTLFFSGCNLRCRFCQNYKISTQLYGKEISVKRLREIYFELIGKGVHNINLVTPTHFSDAILQSLDGGLPVPVVYNSGGYDSVETLRRFEGKIQVYLPDLKYSSSSLSLKYSDAPDCFEVAKSAILEMYRQTGDYVTDENGIIQSGVIIRHLVLPGQLQNTFGVIDWVRDTFSEGQVLFSLMSQYTPSGDISDCPELSSRLTEEEYSLAQDYLFDSGIEDGFMQELSSAAEEYIPDFDLSGVF